MSEPLKSCPLCGGVATLFHDTSADYERQWRYRAECRSLDCEITGPDRKTPEEAIAAWGRRASSEKELLFDWLLTKFKPAGLKMSNKHQWALHGHLPAASTVLDAIRAAYAKKGRENEQL